MNTTLLCVLFISFIAALVRSTLGFGESLIAVPLFLLFLPVTVAVPLSVMMSILIALIIVVQDHRNIHFQSAKCLVFYAILGIPFGLLLLLYANETWVKAFLGILIIVYSLYALFNKKQTALKTNHNKLLFLCGFLSGLLGGAYGLNGPPLVVYGNLKQWSTKHFRATLQAYFLPVSFVGLIGYYVKGLVTTEVNYYFGWSLLAVIPAVFLGRWLNHKLTNQSFFKYVYIGLISIGLLLIGNTVR